MSDSISIPGFVDLQVNGYHGVSYSDRELTAESFATTVEMLAAKGTAAFLATVITSEIAVYEHVLPIIANAVDQFSGKVLGIHLEGPFISPAAGAVGAHDPYLVSRPDPDLLSRLIDLSEGKMRMLTLAPERPGAVELIASAVEQGVVVSIGHSSAGVSDIEAAQKAGASAFTHLGNGMPNNVPRHENIIWYGLAADGMYAGMIADGHHLPPSALKSMIRAKGIDKTCVVSDSSTLAGMPPGEYTTLGNHCILEESGRLHNPRKQCLVGSSATLIDCMNHLASLDFLAPDDLVRLGLDNPLKLIGETRAALSQESIVRFNAASKRFEIG